MTRHMRALFCLLTGLVLAACSSPPDTTAAPKAASTATAPATGDLNIMTFNIRYGTADDKEDRWEKRRGLFMDVVRLNHPDVLGLQEALRFQIDEIVKEFPEYRVFGVGRDDGKSKGEHSAILYRSPRLTLAGDEKSNTGNFWFSDTPEKVASKTWGNGITRICSWVHLKDAANGKTFYVYNLHLDHQSEPSRRKSVELLARRMGSREGADPVIVTGDFNCGEDTPAIQFMTGKMMNASGGADIAGWKGMLDTYRVIHPDVVNVRTFHAFKGVSDTTGKDGPEGALTEKIDYIFVQRGVFEVLDAAIDRTSREGHYPSDHFPVTARVRMKTN